MKKPCDDKHIALARPSRPTSRLGMMPSFFLGSAFLGGSAFGPTTDWEIQHHGLMLVGLRVTTGDGGQVFVLGLHLTRFAPVELVPFP